MTENWGDATVRSHYAGHEGLVYEPRPLSLASLLTDVVRFGERTFLVQGEQRISFATFRMAAAAGAEAMRSRGTGAGDRVMLLAYNSPAWVLGLWSAWLAGAVPVLANRWWSDQELVAALDLIQPAVVVTDVPGHGSLAGWETMGTEEMTACFGASGPGAALPPAPDEDDEAMILFTSGSSGTAKAVRLSHRAVLANQHNVLLSTRRLPHQLRLASPQVVSLVSIPLFHIGGVGNLITQTLTGGRAVFLRGRFSPGEVLELIETERVTIWGGVPTMARRVLEHEGFDRYDLSSLRAFPLGGAPVPPDLLDRLRRQIPHVAKGLANTWGLSESGGYLTLARSDELIERPGTSGRPYPVVEVKVADPDGSGAGELLVRSPTVMLGYLGLDDGTVDSDGWLQTGDVGRVDDAGYVYITGRAKDMVIRGGENIACPHVEAALLRHPDVLEAAVMGVPDDDLGEQLVATVVVRPGAAVSAGNLRAHTAETLAYFEVPGLWVIRTDPLPVLASGKVDKQALLQEHVRGAPC